MRLIAFAAALAAAAPLNAAPQGSPAPQASSATATTAGLTPATTSQQTVPPPPAGPVLPPPPKTAVLPAAPPPQAQASFTRVIPDSSLEQPGERGRAAHTNHMFLAKPEASSSGPSGETPGSLACIYKTVSVSFPGCSKKDATLVPTGGSGIIAIVDAFDYPTAESDLNVFSAKFGLPQCTTANGCFKKVYAGGAPPRQNCGWAQESALDIQWAHAMAPGAKIVLVLANSNSFADLLAAVDVANGLIAASGAPGQVSMSWGGSEFAGEVGYDGHFVSSGVVYFAASGDTGGKQIWPGESPNVVSAGGTAVLRDSAGNFLNEVAWTGSGGGPSQYEYRPPYQDGIANIVGIKRGAPDFSFDADPNTGVSVYTGFRCQGATGWLVFGGTSVASPALAGIVNLAGSHYASTAQQLAAIYGGLPPSPNYSYNFRDITSGTAGTFKAGPNWDFVTGVGSNQRLSGK
ncbi:MAG: S53 family peptidase [Elusimicrobia bacterium]|nr:S53 family peptidase [Elusimicrobiota bacterium]